MQVIFYLPRGYSQAVTQAKEDNVYPEWIDAKFGSKVREMISNDFTIEANEGSFTVDFVYEDDGHAFLKLFGGREA